VDDRTLPTPTEPPLDVVIVGAGASGLYALHRLRGLGFAVTVLDAAGGVGGTWWWNRYPGARCDIESLTYSYSFDEELQQEWRWSERYAAQPEILRYLEHVADRFDLRRDIRFETRVVAAQFDEEAARWLVTTDAGDVLAARSLVMATGCLSVPRYPDIPGVGRFAGEAYHTGLWPHEGVDVRGRRVGILGAGSSAVQALPILAETAEHVTIFQRTPPFSVPNWNVPLTDEADRAHKARYPEIRRLERESMGGNPWLGRDVRVADVTPEERRAELEARYAVGGFFIHSAFSDTFDDADANEAVAEFVRDKIRERVDDPEVAELLLPYEYPFGTKRMCIDVDYYEAYNRPNVRLVSVKRTPITEITERGVVVGGEELAFDVLVYATGFDAMTGALLAVDPVGRGGVRLSDEWAHGARTYLGLQIAGFPNLFTITGPLSPSVLSNMLVSIEQHVDLVTDALVHLRDEGLATMEATAEAQAAWVDHVRELGDETLYPLARSWYMGDNVPGKPRVFLPYVGGVGRYRQECERIVAAGWEGFAFDARRAETAATRSG
jgi:cyclohexanone monooxygenase